MRPALVIVGTLAAVLAACGGVEREPNLAKAVERTEATGSHQIEMTALGVEQGTKIDTVCEGALDYERDRLRFSCAGLEMVVIGETTYVKSEAFGDGTKWMKSPTGEDDPLEELSPDALFALLRAASRQTERVGEDEVRGEPTVRYALTVDCEHAEIVACDGATAVVGVWIDFDGLVRRIRLDQLGLVVDVEFFDFGRPVDIEPPPAEEVVDTPGGFAPQPCAGEEARPIRVDHAVSTLRRHGFDVSRDEYGCSGSTAAVLTSFPENSREFGGALEKGLVSCFVLTKPPGELNVLVVTGTLTPGTSNRPVAEKTLENLDCSLFVEGPNAEDATERLARAFDELQRAIRP